ncbi:MAG: radical SAM protein [Phycisphaerae bacterium]|nr:radical SAM protein [Phycisphaerae bacterium]MDD5381690.1 radical SAM protein [Phycisphaerae bacterium]
MIVFLADLQNSYYRYLRNSIPIGMGYVAAYLKSRFGKDVDVHLFRRFEEIYEALKDTTPHLAAFGSYCWNTKLTLNTAKYIRERCPDAVTAIGGPDASPFPGMLDKDLCANRHVDFYLPNEGEAPAANLMETLLNLNDPEKVRRTMIRGCLSLKPGTSEVWGEVIDRFEGDINEIPSPYFDGLMDRFLSDIDYMPSIQVTRGCPYQCTFCVSGKKNWCKLKTFDLSRVKAEIDYVAARTKNSFMRFADENLGLLPSHLEIVEYLMKKRKETGFPQSGSIYTDKHLTERVKQIVFLMREIIPLCVSYQSLTPEVLKNIKRVNLGEQEVQDVIKFARQNNLILVSELIFMLPGETVQTFLASVQKLVDHRFESMEIQPLQILKGTEMDTPQDRAKYGVKTMFAAGEKGYTRHPALENIEIDEWVVANNTISKEEHFKTLRFIYLLDFAHYRSYLKEFLFFFECHGVRTTKLLMRIVDSPDTCQILSTTAAKYEAGIREFLYETPEQVVDYVHRKIAGGEELLGFYDLRRTIMVELLMADKFANVIDEIAAIGTMICKEQSGSLPDGFEDELAIIKEIVFNSFIPIHRRVPLEVTVESPFDVRGWIVDNYSKPLSAYRLKTPVKLTLKIRGYSFYEDIWAMQETDLTKYRKAFRVFTSANRRRALVAPSDSEPQQAKSTKGIVEVDVSKKNDASLGSIRK